MSPMDNCDEKKAIGWKRCYKCGKANIPWGPNYPDYRVCDNCVSRSELIRRNRELAGILEKPIRHANPNWHKPTKEERRIHANRAHTYKKDYFYSNQPCFFCDYKNCSTTGFKEIVCITGKWLAEELGMTGVAQLQKKDMDKAFDPNKFVCMCSSHARQYKSLKMWHPTWSHDEIVAEVKRRMTPEAVKE